MRGGGGRGRERRSLFAILGKEEEEEFIQHLTRGRDSPTGGLVPLGGGGGGGGVYLESSRGRLTPLTLKTLSRTRGGGGGGGGVYSEHGDRKRRRWWSRGPEEMCGDGPNFEFVEVNMTIEWVKKWEREK